MSDNKQEEIGGVLFGAFFVTIFGFVGSLMLVMPAIGFTLAAIIIFVATIRAPKGGE